MNICTLFICFYILKCSNGKSLRILSGKSARHSQYSYVARMELRIMIPGMEKAHHICSSTVITKAWTLTAAHCNVGLGNALKMIGSHAKGVIRYGPVNKKTKIFRTKDADSSDIIDLLSHPDYYDFSYPRVGFTIRNDVGLVKTNDIHLAQYGRISAVDYTSLYGYELMAVGFGLMNSSNGMTDTLSLKNPLQVVKVLVKKCEPFFKSITYPAMCLAQRCGTATAVCSGDSGGPALYRGRIVAVNSAGAVNDCYTSDLRIRQNIVGILTPVSVYLDWIAAQINNDKD